MGKKYTGHSKVRMLFRVWEKFEWLHALVMGTKQLNLGSTEPERRMAIEEVLGWAWEHGYARGYRTRREETTTLANIGKLLDHATSRGWPETFTVEQLTLHLNGERGARMHDDTLVILALPPDSE